MHVIQVDALRFDTVMKKKMLHFKPMGLKIFLWGPLYILEITEDQQVLFSLWATAINIYYTQN